MLFSCGKINDCHFLQMYALMSNCCNARKFWLRRLLPAPQLAVRRGGGNPDVRLPS